MLQNDALGHYLDALASGDPTPGGGAAAAITAAQGAALLAMVCNLTLGKKKFAEIEGEVKGILETVTVQRHLMLELAEKDTEVFRDVMKAYQIQGNSSVEIREKNEAIDKALSLSAAVPFRLFQACEGLLPYADQLEKIGNPNVLSDVFVGRELLKAGLRSAKINVEVNLKLIKDKNIKESQRQLMKNIFVKNY